MNENIIYIPKITLEAAKLLGQEVIKNASNFAINTSIQIAVCIISKSGNLVYASSMDEAPFDSFDLALNKATASAAKPNPTEAKNVRYNIKGGLPIIANLIGNTTHIGGLGVSGGAQEQDTQIALNSLSNLGYHIPKEWQELLNP